MILRKSLTCALLLGISPAFMTAQSTKSITPGAKVFVSPMDDGFDNYITAALRDKKVPLTIVISKEAADYILTGTSNTQKAGWAKIAFAGNLHSAEEASISLADVKSSEVVFAYNVNKGSSYHGKQSTAEACAKHLKEAIEKGTK